MHLGVDACGRHYGNIGRLDCEECKLYLVGTHSVFCKAFKADELLNAVFLFAHVNHPFAT